MSRYLAAVEHWESLSHRAPTARLAAHDLTAGHIVAGGCAAMAVVTAVSIYRTGGLGTFFGVGFVLICLTCALAADVRALFAPGVLPPLLMITTLATVAVFDPPVIDVDGLAVTAGAAQRTIAGVIDHATALVVGHALALVSIGLRILTASSAARSPSADV